MSPDHDSVVTLVAACPACERPVRAGEYYCADCGTTLHLRWILVPRCESCGGLNPAGFRFCVDCGVPRAAWAASLDTCVVGVDRSPTACDRVSSWSSGPTQFPDGFETLPDAPADSLVETAVWRFPLPCHATGSEPCPVRSGDTVVAPNPLLT